MGSCECGREPSTDSADGKGATLGGGTVPEQRLHGSQHLAGEDVLALHTKVASVVKVTAGPVCVGTRVRT